MLIISYFFIFLLFMVNLCSKSIDIRHRHVAFPRRRQSGSPSRTARRASAQRCWALWVGPHLTYSHLSSKNSGKEKKDEKRELRKRGMRLKVIGKIMKDWIVDVNGCRDLTRTTTASTVTRTAACIMVCELLGSLTEAHGLHDMVELWKNWSQKLSYNFEVKEWISKTKLTKSK